jgi:hypothetical protein
MYTKYISIAERADGLRYASGHKELTIGYI